MQLKDITALIAVDDKHLNELSYSFRSWIYYKEEFKNFKYIVLYDKEEIKESDKRFNIFNNLEVEFHQIQDKDNLYVNQREKMLTSFLYGASELVKTPWYLKIDTDAVATNNSKWIFDGMFDGNVFISNPWGYTKPADAIDILDDWGDLNEEISIYPRLELHPKDGENSVSHSRIISWLFFGNTEWTKKVSSYIKVNNNYKLPIPSQDTYLFYLAKRMNEKYKTIKFKKYGWGHYSRLIKIKRHVSSI